MTTGMTIDAWINQPVLGGRIVDKITAFSNDGYILDMFGANVRLIIGGNDMTSADTVPAGIWTHVAATYSSDGQMAIYINGASVGTKIDLAGRDPDQHARAAHGRGLGWRQPVHRRARRAAHLQPRPRRGRDRDAVLAELQLPVA